MKLKTLFVLLLASGICALFLGGRYIYYGSVTRNCIYTENKLRIPEQLIKNRIIVTKDAYLFVGTDKKYTCLKNIGSAEIEIMPPMSAEEVYLGLGGYVPDKGLELETLKSGEIFQVVDLVAVTKHGISTIDSGSRPLNYLILKDENNIEYKIATTFLGSTKESSFLSTLDSSPSDNILESDSFALIEVEEKIQFVGISGD